MWFGRALAVAGLAWCIGVGIWIWMAPIRSEGIRSTQISRLGPLPLLLPVLIAATGLWGAWRRRRLPLGIATALMLFFVVLTGFSVGSAYLPAVGALGWLSSRSLTQTKSFYVLGSTFIGGRTKNEERRTQNEERSTATLIRS